MNHPLTMPPRRPQIVVGLWDGHDAGAALVREGVVVAAASEERLTRIKGQAGFPSRALRLVLDLAGVPAAAVEVVAVAGKFGRLPARALDQRYAALAPENVDTFSLQARAFTAYQTNLARLPLIRDLEEFGSRLVISERLHEHDLGGARLLMIDHHLAHAVCALCRAESLPALILTMDGYGDGVSSAAWLAGEGCLQRIAADGPRSSAALLYGALTQILGFREGEEGKLTGLAAAQASSAGTVEMSQYVRADGGRMHVLHRPALAHLRRAHAAGATPQELAAALQDALEQAVVHVAQYHLQQRRLRNLAVAGGLFANVSVNGRLASLDIDSFGVFPAMGDQGLCIGAALAASGGGGVGAMPTVFVGDSIAAEEHAPDPAAMARLLAAGQVVGVIRGSMEFGPRALGARSILFDPRAPELARRVGGQLGREPFMPFAPVFRSERWSEIFALPRCRMLQAAAEMTVAIPAAASFAARAPAAVAGDGTVRPQALLPDQNRWLAAVLDRFTALTGCPALINTSFNRHREPIVRTADEAIAAANDCSLDALVIGNQLVALAAHRNSVPERSRVRP